jgi:hypothetical protein
VRIFQIAMMHKHSQQRRPDPNDTHTHTHTHLWQLPPRQRRRWQRCCARSAARRWLNARTPTVSLFCHLSSRHHSDCCLGVGSWVGTNKAIRRAKSHRSRSRRYSMLKYIAAPDSICCRAVDLYCCVFVQIVKGACRVDAVNIKSNEKRCVDSALVS